MRKKTITNEITEVMDIKGITYSDVAAKLGKSKTTVKNWIVGVINPNKKYAEPLADALGVSVSFLKEHITFVDARKQPNRTYRAPVTYKDNFWSKKRVDCGLHIEDVAEVINQPTKTVAAYFSGFHMPEDDVIEAICNLFDVDFLEGKGHFAEANRKYKVENKQTLIASAKGHNKPSTNTEEVKKSKATEPEYFDIDCIESKIYGKVTYSEFNTVMNAIYTAKSTEDVLKAMYGRVDYNLFIKVANIINA